MLVEGEKMSHKRREDVIMVPDQLDLCHAWKCYVTKKEKDLEEEKIILENSGLFHLT